MHSLSTSDAYGRPQSANGFGRLRSTWLLVKSLRRFLFAGMLLEFLWGIGCGFAFFDERWINLVIPFCIIQVMALIGQLPRRLFCYPFPITARQQAWFPMGFAGALWLAAQLGYFCAFVYMVLRGDIPIAMLQRALLEIVSLFPAALFLIALLQGIVWPASWITLYLLPGLMRNQSDIATFYTTAWPAMLGMAILLIFMAPRCFATTDKTRFHFSGSEAKMSEPVVYPCFAQVLVLMIVLITFFVSVPILISMFLQKNSGAAVVWRTFQYHVITVFFVGIPVAIRLLTQDFRRIIASGFSVQAAVPVLLLRATVVFYPISWLLGVKMGNLVRCDSCGKSKLAWQTHCPRCVDKDRIAPASISSWKTYPNQAWGGYMIRLFILIYMIFAVRASYTYDFRYANIMVSVLENPVVANPEKVREELRAALENQTAPWLKTIWGSGVEMPGFPTRANITVKVHPPLHFEVSCACPHWESPEYLLRTVAQDWAERVKDRYQLELQPMEQSGTTGSRIWNALPLDNAIHWKVLSAR